MGGSIGGGKSKGPGGRDPNVLFDNFQKSLQGPQADLLNTIQAELGTNVDNPFIAQIAGQGLQSAAARASSLRGSLDNLPNLLTSSTLGNVRGSTNAALLAARNAGAGRGGLAFGGGAAQIAANVGQAAGSAQSAALGNALVAGQQARSQFDLGLLGQEASIGSALSQATATQAQFREGQIDRSFGARVGARQQLLNILGNVASGGISGSGGSASTRARGLNFNVTSQGNGG